MTITETAVLSRFATLPDSARVWVYQANRSFNDTETEVLRSQINGFVQEWTAHSQQLTALGDVLYGRFIVLAVDENAASASGCSIDKSVHFLQSIESQYQVALFERMTFAFLQNNIVKTASSTDFKRLYTEGVIDDATLVFDNLVSTVGLLKSAWTKPLSASWHKRFV
jgi:predicted metal-dependent hydrolase